MEVSTPCHGRSGARGNGIPCEPEFQMVTRCKRRVPFPPRICWRSGPRRHGRTGPEGNLPLPGTTQWGSALRAPESAHAVRPRPHPDPDPGSADAGVACPGARAAVAPAGGPQGRGSLFLQGPGVPHGPDGVRLVADGRRGPPGSRRRVHRGGGVLPGAGHEPSQPGVLCRDRGPGPAG